MEVMSLPPLDLCPGTTGGGARPAGSVQWKITSGALSTGP